MIAAKDTRLFKSVEPAFLRVGIGSYQSNPVPLDLCKKSNHRHKTMLVRPATPTDAPAIAAIHVASWQAAYRGLMPDTLLDNLSVNQRLAMWEKRLSGPVDESWRTFVCDLDQQIAGWASAGCVRDADLDPAIVGELYGLYTLPGVWGRGVGRTLWLRVLDELRTMPFQAVTLWALTGNVRAHRFYERAGFALDGAEKMIELYGSKFPEIRYRRTLP
jgi:GNAT superfamily N-acetyltransferase